MKEKLLNNLGIKVLSVIAAIFIWLLVVNVDDGMITKTIDDVELDVLNEQAIYSLDKVYQIDNGNDNKIQIMVKGPRSIVEGLTAQDFKATVDLAKLSMTNSVQVQVEALSLRVKNEVTISNANDRVIVKLENRLEQQMPITVQTTDTPAEGYAVGDKSTTPNMITITGAASVVRRINTVQVSVNVAGAKNDIRMTVTPVLLDADGREVTSPRLEVSESTVTATIDIVRTKEIPVRVSTVGEPAVGYQVTDLVYQPTNVLVAGEDANFRTISVVNIDDIKVNGLNETTEINVDIIDYLPDGVQVADGTEQIMIKIEIAPVMTTSMAVTAKDIEVRNLDEDLQYSITSLSVQNIQLEAAKVILDNLKLSDLGLYVDAKKLKPGEYQLELKCNSDINVKLTGTLTVNILIEKKNGGV